MVGALVTERICNALQFVHSSPGFKLIEAEAWTKSQGYRVPVNTLSRVLHKDMTRLHKKTAEQLAHFCEHYSQGKIKAHILLGQEQIGHKKSKNHYKGAHFFGDETKGKDLSTYNLQDSKFLEADISKTKFYGTLCKNTLFDKVTGLKPSFCGARFPDAKFIDCDMNMWDFRGATEWNNAQFRRINFKALLTGVDLSNVSIMEDINFQSGAGATYGLKIKFDPSEITEGADSPECMAHLIELYCGDDLEVLKVIWRLRGGGIKRCWLGGWPDIEREHPKAVNKLMDIFSIHNNWYLSERISFAGLMRACQGDPTRLERLKEHPYYDLFGRALRWEIRLAQKEHLNLKKQPKRQSGKTFTPSAA